MRSTAGTGVLTLLGIADGSANSGNRSSGVSITGSSTVIDGGAASSITGTGGGGGSKSHGVVINKVDPANVSVTLANINGTATNGDETSGNFFP